MSTMTATRRFSSRLFVADDVACTATRHTRAGEEATLRPTLVVPRRGVFQWQSGAASVVAEPNTVLLFDPEQPHRITHPTDNGDDCTALRFSPEQIEDALGEPQRSPRYWILDAPAQISVHVAMQTIRRTHDVLEGEEALMQILHILAQRACASAPSHRAIDLVRERIASDPSERATLAELARDSGLSAYELARRFRTSTGSSIHQYRMRLRLLVALSRLQNGENDLTSLALDLGFSSHAHFSTSFVRMLGIQPQQYRRIAVILHSPQS